MSKTDSAVSSTVTMGVTLAMIMSFQLNHSVWWAIIHGICSWGYVIFRALKGNY
jgi:hypothetical protein